MRLDLAQIKDITLGAVRVEEGDNGICFHRFTEAQEKKYYDRWSEYYLRSLAPSGIRLRFRTDSETLFLKADVSNTTSRSYFAFDVLVNGEKLDSMDNFSNEDLPLDYSNHPCRLGVHSKLFALGPGKKEVCIYFPWSVQVSLMALELDDGAFLEPVKPGKKLLCYGDSITQGYDALYPSNKYISKLADFLDAEENNKAVAGDIFFPDLLSEKENLDLDYITVAYGTNDWSSNTKEAFVANCREFFFRLNRNYPDAKIFVITPIWRKDHEEHQDFGKFEEVERVITNTVADYENMTVFSGFDFINHDEKLYGDLRLHPNDAGFAQYFQSLSQKIATA